MELRKISINPFVVFLHIHASHFLKFLETMIAWKIKEGFISPKIIRIVHFAVTESSDQHLQLQKFLKWCKFPCHLSVDNLVNCSFFFIVEKDFNFLIYLRAVA